ncbi:MAG: hypothetical protein USCAAHI_02348 [Beijerinckiaceae bacterium]|nr:MAG: hypothetical protein USCAAHI_02348 [Beijerinckiaceae bacterium]
MRPQLLHRTILRNRIGAGISVLFRDRRPRITQGIHHEDRAHRGRWRRPPVDASRVFLQRMAFAILEGLLAPVMSTLIVLPPDVAWYLWQSA